MGKFYIETPIEEGSSTKVRYELSATKEVAVSLPSTLTSYPTEKGNVLSDNVVVGNRTVKFEGIVTDVTQIGALSLIKSFVDLLTKKTNPSSDEGIPDKYINGLSERIKNKESFTFHFSEKLKPLENCIITKFAYSKTNKHGGESWLVSISAEEARFAIPARTVREPTDDWKALVQSKTQGSGASSDTPQTLEEIIEYARERGFFTAR